MSTGSEQSNIREDIVESDRLQDFIDIDDISYTEMEQLLTGFCDEILLSEQNSGVSKATIIICKFLVNQAIEFNRKEIPLSELVKSRVLAWKLHDSNQRGSLEHYLFRIIVCLLFEEEKEPYPTNEYLGVFYSCLSDFGTGYCKKFTDYVIKAKSVQ